VEVWYIRPQTLAYIGALLLSFLAYFTVVSSEIILRDLNESRVVWTFYKLSNINNIIIHADMNIYIRQWS